MTDGPGPVAADVSFAVRWDSAGHRLRDTDRSLTFCGREAASEGRRLLSWPEPPRTCRTCSKLACELAAAAREAANEEENDPEDELCSPVRRQLVQKGSPEWETIRGQVPRKSRPWQWRTKVRRTRQKPRPGR